MVKNFWLKHPLLIQASFIWLLSVSVSNVPLHINHLAYEISAAGILNGKVGRSLSGKVHNAKISEEPLILHHHAEPDSSIRSEGIV